MTTQQKVRGNGFASTPKQQAYQKMSQDQVVEQYRRKWELINEQVQNLLESAPQAFQPEELTTQLPHAIVSEVSGILGISPRAGFADTEMLNTIEAIVGQSVMEPTFSR